MKSNENGGCNSARAYAALNCNKLSDVILRKIGKWLTKYRFHANITISKGDIAGNNITSDNIKEKVARRWNINSKNGLTTSVFVSWSCEEGSEDVDG